MLALGFDERGDDSKQAPLDNPERVVKVVTAFATRLV